MVDRLRIELSAPILQRSAAPSARPKKLTPKNLQIRGDGCLLSRSDRLKPARSNLSARVGLSPHDYKSAHSKSAMKNPAWACARRGPVNLSVDAGARHPAESPSLLPCSGPYLCSSRDWRAQCHGRVANSMAAVVPKDMFSLCVMALDMNGRRVTCNPFRRKFFSSSRFSKFETSDDFEISASRRFGRVARI